MQFTFRATHNTLTADLARRVKALQSPQPILRAMGDVIVAETKLAFYNKSARPAPWAPKADGSEATLMKKQVLRRSPEVKSVTSTRVIVGSDRKYAAIHQLGGTIHKPARDHKVRLQAHADGGLKRQEGHGNLAIFAKRKHKHTREVDAHTAAHDIQMPARPYFPFEASGAPTPRLVAKLRAVVERKLAAL